MAEEVVLTGSAQAESDIAGWVSQLPDDIQKQVQTFGHTLVDILHGKQPYLTGTLAGSAELLPGEVDTFFGLSLGREVVYAGWIEFGGSRGREYVPEGRTVYPTAQEAEPQFDRLVEQATEVSINKYPWHQAT